MLITVNRIGSDRDATLSTVSVDGRFMCFGLEDEYRKEKIAHETRIPEGRYRIGLRTEGGFHARYLSRFPEMHKGMLHILDVPDFEYVLIHVGNTDQDTSGCLLVGQGALAKWGDMSLQSSVDAYKKLYPIVSRDAGLGSLEILFIDTDKRIAE